MQKKSLNKYFHVHSNETDNIIEIYGVGKITCKIDTDTVNLANSSRLIGGKRLSLNELVKAYSLRPTQKKTQNKNIVIMQFVVVYMATTNYFHLNYVLSNRLIFTWMQIHWVECSDTTAQSAISTNMPCNEQWTWNLKKRRTFYTYMYLFVRLLMG